MARSQQFLIQVTHAANGRWSAVIPETRFAGEGDNVVDAVERLFASIAFEAAVHADEIATELAEAERRN